MYNWDHNLLPQYVQTALKTMSAKYPDVPRGSCPGRIDAIDKVIERAKKDHPHYFRNDK